MIPILQLVCLSETRHFQSKHSRLQGLRYDQSVAHESETAIIMSGAVAPQELLQELISDVIECFQY